MHFKEAVALRERTFLETTTGGKKDTCFTSGYVEQGEKKTVLSKGTVVSEWSQVSKSSRRKENGEKS